MLGIDAAAIITTVENAQSIRDCPIVKFPRNTVSKMGALVDTELSVAMISGAGLPFPTFTSLIDLIPETLLQRSRVFKITLSGMKVRTAPCNLRQRSQKAYSTVFTSSWDSGTLTGHRENQPSGVMLAGVSAPRQLSDFPDYISNLLSFSTVGKRRDA